MLGFYISSSIHICVYSNVQFIEEKKKSRNSIFAPISQNWIDG